MRMVPAPQRAEHANPIDFAPLAPPMRTALPLSPAPALARSTPPRGLGFAALVLAALSWASLYFVAKPVLGEVRPAAFTLLRYSVAALVFALMLAPRGALPWRQLRRHAPRLALMGLLGYGFFGLMLISGLALSNPAHGATLVATVPISTQLLRWALDGQRPSPAQLGCSLLALAGVALLAGLLGPQTAAPAAGSAARMLLGDLMTLGGSLGWVLYTRGAGQLSAELDPLAYSGLTAIAMWPVLTLGMLGAAVLGWIELPSAAQLRAQGPALLYVGVVPSVMAVLCYLFGVRLLGPLTGGAFLNLIPVSALGLGTLLGQPPSARELLGCVIVVSALLLQGRLQRPGARP